MIRPILAIALKDVKSAYNDARDIILHLLVPVCVGSILGFAFSGRSLPDVRLSVADEAEALREIEASRLDSESKTNLAAMVRNHDDFLSEIRRLVHDGRVRPDEFSFLKRGLGAEIRPESANSFAIVFPGIAVMFMLFSSMGGALGLLKEKWFGVLRRILAAPVSRFQLVAGKALGIFLTTTVQFYVYLIFFVLLWGVRPNGSLAGLVVMSAAICACCAALSMLLACLGRSEAGVHAASLLIVLGMSALGGSMVPYSSMPASMQGAAGVTINKWAIVGLDAVIWRGLGFEAILLPLAILFALTITFLFIGSRLFRFS